MTLVRNIKVEIAISVIRNQSVDEESESDSRGDFLQIAQGKGRESVTFNKATRKHETYSNPHRPPRP